MSRPTVTPWRLPLLVLGVLIACVGGAWLAPKADAMVYWAEYSDDRIGRANLNGSGKNLSFIEVNAPVDIAVTKTHIYWASGVAGGRIGRAKLDGSNINPNFITGLGVSDPRAIAVDDEYVYWANDGVSTIARAKLNGTGVVADFMTVVQPRDIAVTSSHIYWTRAGGGVGSEYIGRANKSGGSQEPTFITAVNNATKVAAGKNRLFWLSLPGIGDVGRVKLNGDGQHDAFMMAVAVGGQDIEALGDRIYWTMGSGGVKTAKQNGSGLNNSFITGLSFPSGLAVDNIKNPGNKFKFGKVSRKRNGTAKLAVKLPGPGKLTLAGSGVKKVKKNAGTGTVKLKVKVKGGELAALHASGSVKLKVKVTFKPDLSKKKRTKKKSVTLRLAR